MRRFSIRGLMVLIVGAAVGFAALRNADTYWAAGMSIAVLMALATSIASALILRGREQCAWTGFAVFSGVYLVFAAFTEFSNTLQNSFDPFRDWVPDAADANAFLCVGHCLVALLFGLVGTVAGKILYARRKRSETQTP
jgi:hypothetical protein